MKILYGIQMNGNGHLTRSLEVINTLKERQHKIDIVTSGNNSSLPHDIKSTHFRGLDLMLNDFGSVSWFKTIINLSPYRFIKDLNLEMVKEYDLIISDFEPITAWSSKKFNKNSIGISNQYSLLFNNIKKPKGIIYNEFIKKFAPCEDYIGLNYLELDKNIYQPIIPKTILNADINKEDFILIYLNNYKIEFLINFFRKFPNIKFIIYANINYTNKNIIVKKQNRNDFLSDITRCHGVITGSGFSTTSETLFLNKKLWSIPLNNHYEQISNSLQLKDM
jgi:uncharacterized protein (TIGR00661 family)